MARESHRLGLLVRRTPPANRWSTGALTPSAVLMPEPPLAPRCRVSAEGAVEVWYLGAAEVVLHPGDTGHHRDNLNSGRPSVWAAIRGADPATAILAALTVDPYEGEGLAGDPALTVEALPMPAELAARLAAFVARHHVEIPFRKRARQPADPDALQARAPRVLTPDQKWGPKR
jgi:hypothetical protein